MEEFETHEEMVYALIIDDLEQTISAADKKILEEWRSAAEVNEKTYQDFVEVQNSIDKIYNKNGFDTQLSWESLDAKITDTKEVALELKGKGSYKLWYQIAAAVLVLCSAGYYFLTDRSYVTVSTAATTAVSQLTLPDGTELTLNSGTTVRYDKENFNTSRKLILEKGEVFVHVVLHNSKQFSVDLGDVQAEDIGTSFNVSKAEKHASVIVEEGKVAMKQNGSANQVLLTPGMVGRYEPETKQLVAGSNSDLNYKAWMDKKFTFREMPLDEVALQLQKVYKMPLIIKGDALKLRKLNARLHYQTLDSVLEVISASLQCKATKEQNTYVLSVN